MSFEEALARWEQVTGYSRDDLPPDYLAFRRAQYELEDESGDYTGRQYGDPKWQMAFWKKWFSTVRGLNAAATGICAREINKLRGR